MHNPESVLVNDSHKVLCYSEILTDRLILARRPDRVIVNNKKKNLPNSGLFRSSWPHGKNWKKLTRVANTYTLLENWKKLWNMKVTVIPVVIGALATFTKGLIQRLEDLEIRGRVETIQTTALLRSARILRGVLDTWGDLQSLRLQWETIS